MGVGLKDAYSMSLGLKGQCLNQGLRAVQRVKDVGTKRTSIFKGIVNINVKIQPLFTYFHVKNTIKVAHMTHALYLASAFENPCKKRSLDKNLGRYLFIKGT